MLMLNVVFVLIFILDRFKNRKKYGYSKLFMINYFVLLEIRICII